MPRFTNPRDALRYHVSGAIARGEKQPIAGQPRRERLNLNDPRQYAESVAREQADHYRNPWVVIYAGKDEFGEVWRASPLGDRRDPGGFVAGCAWYSVHPVRDSYRYFI